MIGLKFVVALLVASQASQPAAPPPGRRAALLTVQVPAAFSDEQRQCARTVERALLAGLRRHSDLDLMDRSQLEAFGRRGLAGANAWL